MKVKLIVNFNGIIKFATSEAYLSDSIFIVTKKKSFVWSSINQWMKEMKAHKASDGTSWEQNFNYVIPSNYITNHVVTKILFSLLLSLSLFISFPLSMRYLISRS